MDITPIIVASIGAVAGVLSVIFQIARDRRKSNADALTILEASNARLAERLEKTAMRVDELEALLERSEAMHKAQMDEIRAKYEKALLENDDLREWAERLVYQVKSFGNIEPVKIRVRAAP